MGEWEYRFVDISATESGIFVRRGDEWRLFLTLGKLLIADPKVTGPRSASAIALAMGWDTEDQVVAVEPIPKHAPYIADREKAIAALTEIAEKVRPPAGGSQAQGLSDQLIEAFVTSRSDKPAPKFNPKWSQWTEQAEDRLRQHRSKGLSYKVIAERMTREFGKTFTSSMCSAKADRLGLPKHPFIGGRPKAKASKPAQEAKADKAEGIDSGSLPADTAVESAPAPADVGAHPAAGANGMEHVAGANGIARGIPAYPPPIRDSVGFWPKQPVLNEAVVWYRDNGPVSRVFKIRDGDGFKLQVDGGELLAPEEFIKPVNELRVALGLDPFDLSAQ